MTFEKVQGKGAVYTRLTDAEYNYTFGYYSNNSWVDDHRIVLQRFKNLEAPTDHANVLVDLDTGTEEVLPFRGGTVVYQNNIYFIKDGVLSVWDLETRETRELYREEGMTFAHMTADGRFINWAAGDHGTVLDLQTGEATRMETARFAKPFNMISHMMICPTDPNIMFFCHEGTTEYVSNRLWISEKGKPSRHIAEQHLDANGNLGDCFGHESWAPDGKGLYFIKYKCSPQPPRGICYVDVQTGKAELLYSAFHYWHVCCSPKANYLASDTQDGTFSGVCLVDQRTGKEQMLVEAGTNWTHPCHPHPMFSPEERLLMFHELVDGKCALGIIDIQNDVQ